LSEIAELGDGGGSGAATAAYECIQLLFITNKTNPSPAPKKDTNNQQTQIGKESI
jgi:hypothetical protein